MMWHDTWMLTWHDISSSSFLHRLFLLDDLNTSLNQLTPYHRPSTVSLARLKHFVESTDTQPTTIDDFLLVTKILCPFGRPDHWLLANFLGQIQHL
jgi:hypothetical protein